MRGPSVASFVWASEGLCFVGPVWPLGHARPPPCLAVPRSVTAFIAPQGGRPSASTSVDKENADKQKKVASADDAAPAAKPAAVGDKRLSDEESEDQAPAKKQKVSAKDATTKGGGCTTA